MGVAPGSCVVRDFYPSDLQRLVLHLIHNRACALAVSLLPLSLHLLVVQTSFDGLTAHAPAIITCRPVDVEVAALWPVVVQICVA